MRVAHAPGMPGTFSPLPLVSDPDMHHSTCIMHVLQCMVGSRTSVSVWSRLREKVPSIPSPRVTRNFAYLVRGHWTYISSCEEGCLKYWCRHSCLLFTACGRYMWRQKVHFAPHKVALSTGGRRAANDRVQWLKKEAGKKHYKKKKKKTKTESYQISRRHPSTVSESYYAESHCLYGAYVRRI